MKKILFCLVLLAALCGPAANAQTQKTFSCNFENSGDAQEWTFVNDPASNSWYTGNIEYRDGSYFEMYVSNDNGATNSYSSSTGENGSIYALHDVWLKGNTTATLYFVWRCQGEIYYGNPTDFLRVALIPMDSVVDVNTYVGPYSLPAGWIALDGDSALSQSNGEWIVSNVSVTVPTTGGYRLAFIWSFDISMVVNPPAAVDDITFTYTEDPYAPVTVNEAQPFQENFEDWVFRWELYNGTCTNFWMRGEALYNDSTTSLYITNNGDQYNYNNTRSSTVYASKRFNLAKGKYDFGYDWRCMGENCCDYLRVALVPGSPEFTASTSTPAEFSTNTLPAGWIPLDGGSKLNNSENWTTQEVLDLNITEPGIYSMVFVWRNDGSVGDNPPAGIDNISVSKVACPSPNDVTVSDITTTTALLQFSPCSESNSFTYVLDKSADFDLTNTAKYTTMTGASKTLTGLEPYTKYTIAVRTDCSTVGGRWTEPVTFLTIPDCGAQSVRQFAIGSDNSSDADLPFSSYLHLPVLQVSYPQIHALH